MVLPRKINVVAMRRSGCHAIVEWIAHHFSGPVLFSNNLRKLEQRETKRSHVFNCDRDSDLLVKKQFDAHISLIEDPHREYDALEDMQLPQDETNVFVLRSFWNLAASRFEAKVKEAVWNDSVPLWWLDFAEIAMLSPAHRGLSYDDWCKNDEWRAVTSQALSLPILGLSRANELSIKTAHQGYCGSVGSSFDKFRQRGDTTKRFEQSEKIQQLAKSNDKWVECCRELNKQIFGWTLNHDGEII